MGLGCTRHLSLGKTRLINEFDIKEASKYAI
jgi:hypothetical protein